MKIHFVAIKRNDLRRVAARRKKCGIRIITAMHIKWICFGSITTMTSCFNWFITTQRTKRFSATVMRILALHCFAYGRWRVEKNRLSHFFSMIIAIVQAQWRESCLHLHIDASQWNAQLTIRYRKNSFNSIVFAALDCLCFGCNRCFLIKFLVDWLVTISWILEPCARDLRCSCL